MLDNPAMMHEDDVLGEPPRLADVVSDDNDLDASMLGVDEKTLDG